MNDRFEAFRLGEEMRPLIVDVTDVLHTAREAGEHIMFEGAQGSLLDIPDLRSHLR